MINDALPESNQEQQDDFGFSTSGKMGSAVLSGADWTTQTILNQLDRGNIDLDPIYQRRDAWKAQRKSLFIESLIIGLPVPQIVLAERKEKRGSYIVIDGKQRLLSLRQFSSDGNGDFKQLRLSGLEIRADLNGQTYASLSGDPTRDEDLSAFENQTIRTVVIKNWPNENFLYTVFLRLNTGSVPLSPQELRQALHPGQFTNFVNQYVTDSRLIKDVLKLDEPDFRMRDTELVVRFLAFLNFLGEYKGNLKPLLDRAVIKFNKEWGSNESIIQNQIRRLELGIRNTIAVFGLDSSFRKWNGVEYERQINRAVFDIMSYYLSQECASEFIAGYSGKVVIADIFKHLCTDSPVFKSSLEGTTKSIESIRDRFMLFGSRLKDTHIPGLRLPNVDDAGHISLV